MPTDFTTTFGLGDVIQHTHVLQFAEPVNRIETGESYYAEDVGSVNAFEVSMTPVPDAYTEGMMVHFKAANATTGPATLEVNSLGTRDLLLNGSEPVTAGTISSGQVVAAMYDGSAFQLVGANLPSAAQVQAEVAARLFLSRFI